MEVAHCYLDSDLNVLLIYFGLLLVLKLLVKAIVIGIHVGTSNWKSFSIKGLKSFCLFPQGPQYILHNTEEPQGTRGVREQMGFGRGKVERRHQGDGGRYKKPSRSVHRLPDHLHFCHDKAENLQGDRDRRACVPEQEPQGQHRQTQRVYASSYRELSAACNQGQVCEDKVCSAAA